MAYAFLRRFFGGLLMGTFFLPPFVHALIGYRLWKSAKEAEQRAERQAELQKQRLDDTN